MKNRLLKKPETLPLEIENASSFLNALELFQEVYGIKSKGSLSVILVLTDKLRSKQPPYNINDFITPGGGQIAGASGSAANKILGNYGVECNLSSEGGRTSRGTIGNCRHYIDLVNAHRYAADFDLEAAVNFWVAKVSDFLNTTPFKLKRDPYLSVTSVFADLLDQAERRRESSPNIQFTGAMLQHFVGAKLELLFPDEKIAHHASSTADSPGGRDGDFRLKDTAIHVTIAPGEALCLKCKRNLDAQLRPLIVTVGRGVDAADVHLRQLKIRDRVEVFEFGQFMAANIYEMSAFSAERRTPTIDDLIRKYNELVAKYEIGMNLHVE